jgi:hypothetical protein
MDNCCPQETQDDPTDRPYQTYCLQQALQRNVSSSLDGVHFACMHLIATHAPAKHYLWHSAVISPPNDGQSLPTVTFHDSSQAIVVLPTGEQQGRAYFEDF